jgi:hypothetical protein
MDDQCQFHRDAKHTMRLSPAARGKARWPDSARPRHAGKNAAREEAAPAGNGDVQPGRAARVRARASGRQRVVDQCGVHRDLLLLPLGRREHARAGGPTARPGVLNGEGRRGRGWQRWGGVVEHGDLGADGAKEAVDEGGSTQVGDVGVGRKETRGARGRERKRAEVGAEAEQPSGQRHGDATCRRRRAGGSIDPGGGKRRSMGGGAQAACACGGDSSSRRWSSSTTSMAEKGEGEASEPPSELPPPRPPRR